MKLKNVPQDADPTYEGAKKLCYALDENGQFKTATTNGWSVEATVKNLAWQNIEKDLEKTRQQVRSGELSPLGFFMKFRQMDTSLLAQNMGISSWRVKWHLRPRVFRGLPAPWLKKYSDCLEIPVETLKNYTGQE